MIARDVKVKKFEISWCRSRGDNSRGYPVSYSRQLFMVIQISSYVCVAEGSCRRWSVIAAGAGRVFGSSFQMERAWKRYRYTAVRQRKTRRWGDFVLGLAITLGTALRVGGSVFGQTTRVGKLGKG